MKSPRSNFSAILFTTIENYRRLGLNPFTYLRDVLTRLPHLTNHQTQTLTLVTGPKNRLDSVKRSAN